MNKKTATHNPSDVYEAFAQLVLKENPEAWPKHSRVKKRKNNEIFVMKKAGSIMVPEEIISIERWLRIVNLYYLLARKKVIAGGKFRFGHRLGVIQARTVSRNFNNKQVNWAETKKQPMVVDPETGKRKRAKIIYHTSETYCRIAWEKLGAITNERVYKFKPSKGNRSGKGFSGEFCAALRADPLLETRYKQFINELSFD
jgi:hypothetical protein